MAISFQAITIDSVRKATTSSYLAFPYESCRISNHTSYALTTKRIAINGIERNYISCTPGDEITMEFNWDLTAIEKSSEGSTEYFFIPIACKDGTYVDSTLTYARSIPVGESYSEDDSNFVLAAFDIEELAKLRFRHARSGCPDCMSKVTLKIPSDAPTQISSGSLRLVTANVDDDRVVSGKTPLIQIVLEMMDETPEPGVEYVPLTSRYFTIEVVRPSSKL